MGHEPDKLVDILTSEPFTSLGILWELPGTSTFNIFYHKASGSRLGHEPDKLVDILTSEPFTSLGILWELPGTSTFNIFYHKASGSFKIHYLLS